MGFFGSPAPFLFSCFAVATVGAKIAHLVAHITAIPLSAFILYLPTFLCLDFIVICAARLLFHNGRSAFSLACALVGTVISYVSPAPHTTQRKPSKLTTLQSHLRRRFRVPDRLPVQDGRRAAVARCPGLREQGGHDGPHVGQYRGHWLRRSHFHHCIDRPQHFLQRLRKLSAGLRRVPPVG